MSMPRKLASGNSSAMRAVTSPVPQPTSSTCAFCGGAGLELDPGHPLLAILLAGHADHLHVADRRMPVEEFLHLARIDVVAAADDHVLDAAHDVQIPVLVHRCEIAGVHPARGVDG